VRSTGGTVVPHGKGSLEVEQADNRATVESGVDRAEAQDLGLGAAGGGAAQAGPELAQAGIALLPKLPGRTVATEKDFGNGGGPLPCYESGRFFCHPQASNQ
jgi:hypothetical protein